jgi:type I restriction enzyme S subunit
MNSLPKGWGVRPLSSLVENPKNDIVDGPFGSNLKRSDFHSSGVPVLKIQNIKPNKLHLKNIDYVTTLKAATLERHSFVTGDIVMTKLGAPLGVSAIVGDELPEGIIVADLVRIRPGNVNTKFLCYQLNSPSISKFINDSQKGTTRPRVNIQTVRNLPIVVPPIEEQNRIVETLEKHLLRLDKALVELESSSRLKNNFKDSLIHGIVSGHYSDNLSTWQVTTLGQVAKWSSGGTPQSGNPNYYGGQIPWCVIGDLTESLVTETAKTITDEGLAASSAKIVNPGTVLLAMYGASIGRTGIAGTPMATNQAIACAVPNANLDPNYLLLYLQSQKRMFIESGKGGAQPNISQTIIKAWALNLPPIEEQKRLLGLAESHQATIKSLSEVSLKLEDQYLTLKRSLLNAAFTGGLVA